jgi:hypothetical protein
MMIDRAAYRLLAIVAKAALSASIVAAFWALSGNSEVTIEGAVALAISLQRFLLAGWWRWSCK